jgi:hypothetical protein
LSDQKWETPSTRLIFSEGCQNLSGLGKSGMAGCALDSQKTKKLSDLSRFSAIGYKYHSHRLSFSVIFDDSNFPLPVQSFCYLCPEYGVLLFQRVRSPQDLIFSKIKIENAFFT